MTNRPRPFVLLCAFCLLALAFAGASFAQMQSAGAEKPAVYTYVSEWTVPRNMWGDYQKQEAADEEIMKKQIADGTLTAFGSYTVIVHQEGAPTHGTWFSANSMANLMKALETLRTAPGATSAPFAAAKHWDYVLRSTQYGFQSGTFTNGYLRVSNWAFKKDAGPAAAGVVKETIVAMLDKLVSDGSVHGYEVEEEAVHSQDPGTFFIAVVTNGAEGLDKFESAIDAMEKDHPVVLAALGGTLSEHGHRDVLAKVDTMTHK